MDNEHEFDIGDTLWLVDCEEPLRLTVVSIKQVTERSENGTRSYTTYVCKSMWGEWMDIYPDGDWIFATKKEAMDWLNRPVD